VTEIIFENWTIEYDKAATQALYNSIPIGSAEECLCDACTYFAKNRTKAFPLSFLEFLQTVGIDFQKEAEVYTFGDFDEKAPKSYQGWFHLIGNILIDSGKEIKIDQDGFSVIFLAKKDLIPEEWRDHSVIQIEFSTTIP
jgi:hypothetical protein